MGRLQVYLPDHIFSNARRLLHSWYAHCQMVMCRRLNPTAKHRNQTCNRPFLYQTKHKHRIQDKSKNHRSSQRTTTQQNITDALTIQFIQGRLIREQVTGGE